MKAFQPADHLHSRTFIGLLVAQFLAAFNDQAIHAAAMFFAYNTGTLSEARAITLMPILFYAPWAIFPTISGYFADRFSKRFSLVFWKFVEVAITLLALFGFWLGRNEQPAIGSYIVLATVFLMGMHSAFFVPAKYGAMPEILTPRMLSKGNGVLESLSFLAVILGTVFGGVLSSVFRGEEYLIGVILTIFALVGAVASLFIERMPAANPDRSFPAYVYKPLWENVRLLLTSRPLIFAVVGIAFFTFLVAYMRAVVYMHGQSQLPPWSEAQTSYIVGMVALGIGIGSPLVGYLSGGKVEVGLVPIGAVGMMIATSVAAFALHSIPILCVCIILIGFFTGFYLVPLFSLLQHRAPRTSKGDSIATSNFINITGAIAASLVFGLIDWTAVRTGFAPALQQAGEAYEGFLWTEPEFKDGHPSLVLVGDHAFEAHEKGPKYVLIRLSQNVEAGTDVAVRTYVAGNVTYHRVQPIDEAPYPVHDKQRLPALLFLSAGGMTLFTLFWLWYLLPDLFQRTRIWLATRFRQNLEVAGMLRLPASGSVVLVTDAVGLVQCQCVVGATDRVTRFVLVEERSTVALDLEILAREGRRVLDQGEVVGLSLTGPGGATLLERLLREGLAPILPVHCLRAEKLGRLELYVVAGALLPPATPPDLILSELSRVREDLARRIVTGEPFEKEESGH